MAGHNFKYYNNNYDYNYVSNTSVHSHAEGYSNGCHFSAFVSQPHAGKQLNTASFGSNEGFRSIEVSSAKHSLQKLTDNNPNTYWQSSDSASPPWIKLNMKEDALIKLAKL